jgi:hypothetical protein
MITGAPVLPLSLELTRSGRPSISRLFRTKIGALLRWVSLPSHCLRKQRPADEATETNEWDQKASS